MAVSRVSAGCQPASPQPSVIPGISRSFLSPLVPWLRSGFGDSESRTLRRGLFVNSSLAGDGEFDTLSSEILGLKRGEPGSQKERLQYNK